MSPRRPLRGRRAPALVAGTALALVALSGCSDDPAPPAPATAEPAAVDPFADVAPEELSVVARAAAWAPVEATEVRVTDWDRVRDRLGLPSLTGASETGDRARFWREARDGAVVLTPSTLHALDDRLLRDFGFTADDVDWQADVRGPGGEGSVLALRPDLPLDGVRRAVAAGVGTLEGARLVPDAQVVLTGALADAAAGPGEDSWRTDPALAELLVGTARESAPESVLLRRGCLPLDDVLGGDVAGGGGGDEAARVRAAHDLGDLEDVAASSVAFGDLVATVRLGLERADLFERAELVGDWPPVGRPTFAAAFGPDPVVDPSTGRLGLMVDDPAAAAAVTRAGVLPWAVCPD
ncbi:hypothetical protein [Nocardioides perillae]|uniref:Uncharacterized protein n=1 Tax=Nocardioides perillae TaxID=1119534 RepID=A0A7Y9UKP4_9ACTN|nr:hypothetical protein [Nocardioides perillae]NYG54177.1 hypothetical protein [Nocardioides perillae]